MPGQSDLITGDGTGNQVFLESGPFETQTAITAPSRTGVFGSVQFNSGLSLYSMHLMTGDAVRDLIVKTEDAPVFGFRFCLSGRKKLLMPSFKKGISIIPGHWSVFHFTDDHCYHHFIPNDELHILYVVADPNGAGAWLKNTGTGVETGVSLPPKGDTSGPFHLSRPFSPDIYACLHRMFHCPYEGRAKMFYVEAKTMELIAHALHQLTPPSQAGAGRLRPGDIDRMHHAGQRLVSDVANPPELSDLARETGVSRTKFFTTFRQVHGIPPSAYLRRARMENARRLLENQEMNIAEIAAHLGFSCAGHFTRTFKQHFGSAPSQYRKMNE